MGGSFKWIFFDCMETLIDLTELPKQKDYALWAFNGSGCEIFWSSFEEFFEEYQLAKKIIEQGSPPLKEHEISLRFDLITKLRRPGIPGGKQSAVKEALCENFWRTYMAKCYVRDEVKTVLQALAQRYCLGVVSNFTVFNGIEELLSRNHIRPYFTFVITSVKEGWRKPHPRIYQAALEKARVSPEQILFVGDDVDCDYVGTKKTGFYSLLLDRYDRFQNIPQRVNNFHQLHERLMES